MLDLANFEKEREKRHQLEKEKREKEKDVDYKSILRDARRVERSELNKALDTREKLRQQRLKEEDNMDHEMIQISKETKESDWEQYDQQRNAHRNERESLAKKRLNQRHEELVSFRKQIHLQQQEQEDVERRREEWVTIYEVRNKEENALLPETVQEEILVNVLQHEGSEDGEETIDFRSERLKKNKNNTTASHLRTVDQDIYDTKRIFLDNSLSRAKNHRRDRQ
uniref:Trichohyalin-plectin-homology domain-containing protein n=1 Tax=Arcella intermedia TaxID=1963864 RepID=A0A6B2LC87_9EUKA